MEMLIVIIAVGISICYVVRRFWASFTQTAEGSCQSGCAGCACSSEMGDTVPNRADTCGDPPENNPGCDTVR